MNAGKAGALHRSFFFYAGGARRSLCGWRPVRSYGRIDFYRKDLIVILREVHFRMERPDLLQPGDEAEMTESRLNTLSGTMYYYTIEPALAMSDNIPAAQRLTSLHAVVKDVVYENSVYTVTALCE